MTKVTSKNTGIDRTKPAREMAHNLGVMMGVGLVVGLITVLLSDFVFIKIHDRGIWNEEKDVNHSSNVPLLREGRDDLVGDDSGGSAVV